MKSYRFFKALKIAVLVVAASFVFGFVIMHLWNWLMPRIFTLPTITFWQALGLFVLSKLLFGGVHRHGGRGPWRRHMRERWAAMSPEEQEKFRTGMRGRRGCRVFPAGEAVSERSSL